MRLAIVSDVHANLEALTAVLREFDRHAVDRVISLGDAVGYHANPNECVDLLAGAGALTIAGNHDRAAVGAIEPDEFGSVARHAVLWTRRALLPEHQERLRELGVFARLDERVCVVHAALHPTPNDRYHLSTAARIAASFAVLRFGDESARVCFYGHTHVARVHRHDDDHARALASKGVPRRVTLDDGYYLVNPGSVGQPRDGDDRASFAIFDDRSFDVEFFRVAYDRERCLRKAAAHGLLGDRRPAWRRALSRFARH
ncbi:MAG TPA: metallophosphoesterase family protein [Polyangiaceae bacterium]